MNNNIFIDFNSILSYCCLLNIIITERGVGKTYGATKFVIDDFLKKSNEFAYIRRYKNEISEAVPNFFSAINQNNEFPNNNLSTKGKKFYIDNKIFGHAMTLSTAQDLKSSNFSRVKNIIFDEFLIEEGQKKYYLKNEVFTFLNLLETICRLREVRVFMLGNAVTISNPYFIYFDLHLPHHGTTELFKNNTILVHYSQNKTYQETKEKSKFRSTCLWHSFC